MGWTFYDSSGSQKVAPASVQAVTAQMYATAAQTFTAGSLTQILFDTVDWDTGSITSTSGASFTVPTAGKYLVEVNLSQSGTGSNGCAFILKVNGIATASAVSYDVGGYGGGMIGHAVLNLSAGDVVTTYCQPGTSGTFTTNTTNEPKYARASITKIDGAVVQYVQTPYNGINVTMGQLTSGPPTAPSDGDIWIAKGVDGAGVRWSFQYNAAASSSYKWEFIGGAPLYVKNTNVQSSSTTSYFTPTDAWTLTVTLEGDYYVCIGAGIGNNTSGDGAKLSYKVGSTAASDANACTGNYTPSNNGIPTVTTVNLHRALPAGTVLTEQFRAYNGGTAAHTQSWAELIPIRIIG